MAMLFGLSLFGGRYPLIMVSPFKQGITHVFGLEPKISGLNRPSTLPWVGVVVLGTQIRLVLCCGAFYAAMEVDTAIGRVCSAFVLEEIELHDTSCMLWAINFYNICLLLFKVRASLVFNLTFVILTIFADFSASAQNFHNADSLINLNTWVLLLEAFFLMTFTNSKHL